MGETEEAKEELTKQNLGAEPLLIILSPPPSFLPVPGQPTMSWHRWLRSFENYLEELGESKVADSTKCVLLQNCLGQEGQRIYTTLMPGVTSYSDAISALTIFFTSDLTSQMHRLNFHQRAQMDGETATQFICSLVELLRPCDYQDEQLILNLILNRLVEKTNNPQLRERLLSETKPLTLAKTLHICEEVDSLGKCESLVHEVNVYIGDDVEPLVRKAKRGRPRRGENRPKTTVVANITPRRTSMRRKDDFYYDNDKQFYSDDGDSNTEKNYTSNQPSHVASQKEKKPKALPLQNPEASPKLIGPCCPICTDRRFRGINKLLRHMRTHTQEKPFRCPQCDLTFSQTYHMTRHMRNQHGAGQHVCPICGVTLSNATELQSHKKMHPPRAVPCPFCEVECPDNRLFASHLQFHVQEQCSQTGGPVSRKTKELAVLDPDERYDMSGSVAPLVKSELMVALVSGSVGEHIDEAPVQRAKRGRPRRGETRANNTRSNSTEIAKTTCRFEGENTEEASDKKSRDIGQQSDIASPENVPERTLVKTEVSESDVGNPDLILTDLKHPHCPVCIDKKFKNINKLLRHMQTHSQEKPFSCSKCGMTFSQAYHMMRHMRNQHGAGQFVCSTCGMDLGSYTELLRHKMTHPPQAVPCPYCGEISPNYHRFLGHIKFHSKNVSETEEQAVESDRPVSDDSDDMSESEVNSKLLDHEVSMDTGAVVQQAQKEENVAPLVQKAKRGRPRRDETMAKTSRTRLKDDYYYSNNKLYYGEDSDDAEGDSDRSNSKTDVISPVESNALSSNTVSGHNKNHPKEQLSQRKEPISGKSQDGDMWEVAESDTEMSEDMSDSDQDRSYKGRSSKRSVKGDNRKCKNGQQAISSPVKANAHFCPHCEDRWFRGAAKLARHMRMHTKEKPFKCPICEKFFSQSYHMKRHQRLQHGDGEYICSQCGQALHTWRELKAHTNLHSSKPCGPCGPLACHLCNQQFKYKAAYLTHIKLHNTHPCSPKGYSCGDCGKIFKRRYHLKRHIAGHRKATNGEYYTCKTCQKIFAFPEDLKRHMDKHEKERNGICSVCNKIYSSPEELEAHMEETHNRTYSCQTCGKKFKLEHALKKHEEGHVNGQYYCAQCCKYFQKHSHYKRHTLVHKRKECRCPHCDTIFLKMNAFKYHLRTHTSERPYQCTCCIESFEHQEEFDQHCLKHKKLKKQRPYSCTRCDWAFTTLTELAEHMNTHEGEQPVNCAICGKTFLNKSKLEKHMSIHTGERPHLCSICGNGFPSAASLKLHTNIHTGVKPFQCGHCSKSFSTASSLRLHGRQHMAVRPTFECPECGRTYGRMTELKMHQRYHTGDKPYACTCCSKRFISRDKLNVHMRIHTGERPYSCSDCGQTFSQAGDRNRHMKKYH